MKLFFYYAFCSFKNQIKKLFRSWVAIFLAVCLLLGVVLGLGVGLLTTFLEEDSGDEAVTEEIPEEELEGEPLDPETALGLAELAVAGVVLLILFFSVFSADKNGSSIFLMADVNLLFSAPLKPQSVLLFRLGLQIFLLLFTGFYFLPNLTLNMGLSVAIAFVMLAIWVIALLYGRLLSILLYTVCSTHASLKKWIRPVLYALVILLAGCFYLHHTSSGASLLTSAFGFFNTPLSRWIPIYGWLKGLMAWALLGDWLRFALSLLLLVGCVPPLAIGIWHVKADFYEDAMAKSAETAEKQAATQSGKTVQRTKDRGDRIRRDGLRHGSGASMFFFKTVYNRFRFAYLRMFTKTSLFYLFLAVGLAVLLLLVADRSFYPLVGLLLSVVVFFRSMGNPISRDVNTDYFVTIPASPWAKVGFSLLGGSFDCALDLLPASVLSAILMRASVWEAVAYFLLALSLDFYASNVMLFLELSLPTSLALQIKQAISILFIYFGILPIGAVVLVGFILHLYLPFLYVAAMSSVLIGGVLFAFSPLFIQFGRK